MRPLLACVAGVIVLEVVLFAALGQLDAPLRGGDAATYVQLASNLVHHHAFSDSVGSTLDANVSRSPGYPAFLATLQLAGLTSLSAIRIVQLLLLGITAYLTGLIGARLAGPRAGWIAAVATASYLPLVWLTTDQMTESLAGVGFAALTLLMLYAAGREGRPALVAWALAGCVLGLTAYVRPTTLYLAVPAAVLILVQTRRPAAVAWFSLAVVVVIAPWSVRTSLLADHVVALEVGAGNGRYASAGQFAGSLGIPLDGLGWVRYKTASRRITHSLRLGRYTPREQLQADERLRRAAPPVTVGDVARRLPARMAALWGPDDETPANQAWSASAHRLAVLQFWVLAAAALFAVSTLRRRLWRLWPLWLPAAYLTAVHTVLHVETRYTMPARPLLIVLAAIGIAAAWGRLQVATQAPPAALAR